MDVSVCSFLQAVLLQALCNEHVIIPDLDPARYEATMQNKIIIRADNLMAKAPAALGAWLLSSNCVH